MCILGLLGGWGGQGSGAISIAPGGGGTAGQIEGLLALNVACVPRIVGRVCALIAYVDGVVAAVLGLLCAACLLCRVA